MDRERFSNYVDSPRRRRRLIAAIWVPIALISLLLDSGRGTPVHPLNSSATPYGDCHDQNPK